jgi:hypothetical protein
MVAGQCTHPHLGGAHLRNDARSSVERRDLMKRYAISGVGLYAALAIVARSHDGLAIEVLHHPYIGLCFPDLKDKALAISGHTPP